MTTPKSIAQKFSDFTATPAHGSDTVFRKSLEDLEKLSRALRDKLSLESRIYPSGKEVWSSDEDPRKRAVYGRDVNAESTRRDYTRDYTVVAFAEDNGTRTVYRTSLQVSFAHAVTGDASQDKVWNNSHILSGRPDWEVVSVGDSMYNRYDAVPIKEHAKLWIRVEAHTDGKTSFTIQPDKSAEMPNKLPYGLFGQRTFWSIYGLQLIGKDGFRHKTYTSNDGSLPPELVDDLLRLYKTGVAKKLFVRPAGPA